MPLHLGRHRHHHFERRSGNLEASLSTPSSSERQIPSAQASITAPAHTPTSDPADAPTADGTVRPGGRNYPDALPSLLASRYKEPVEGTVVIGADFPEQCPQQESLFELVAPDGEVLNPARVTAHSMIRSIAGSLQQQDACPSLLSFTNGTLGNTSRGNATTTTVTTTAAASSGSKASNKDKKLHGNTEAHPTATPPAQPLQNSLSATSLPVFPSNLSDNSDSKKDSAKQPEVLKKGGFVVFSDAYITAHPESPIASITQNYRNMSSSLSSMPMVVDPKLDENKQRLEKIKHMIQEAEGFQRPLFRRRPSFAVYGSAEYVKLSESEAATAGANLCCSVASAPDVLMGDQVPDDSNKTPNVIPIANNGALSSNSGEFISIPVCYPD